MHRYLHELHVRRRGNMDIPAPFNAGNSNILLFFHSFCYLDSIIDTKLTILPLYSLFIQRWNIRVYVGKVVISYR